MTARFRTSRSRRKHASRCLTALLTSLAVAAGGTVAASAAVASEHDAEAFSATLDGADPTPSEPDEPLADPIAMPPEELTEEPASEPAEEPSEEPAEEPAEDLDKKSSEDKDTLGDGVEPGDLITGEVKGDAVAGDAPQVPVMAPARNVAGPEPPGEQTNEYEPIEPNAAGDATIRVRVGGQRSGTDVTNLAGVTLGLFDSRTAAAPLGDDWALATSGVDGYAVFTVPASAFTGNTARTFWVGGVSAPPTTQGQLGWFLNGELGTTLISPVNAAATAYRFSVSAQRNGEYISGAQFMAPGSSNTLTGSTGAWAVSRENPPMPTSCQGLDIAVLVDVSASVLNYGPALRGATAAYINALADTPSSMQIFQFGTSASAVTALEPLNSTAAVQRLLDGANSLTPTSSNYTNWDAGLWAVAQVATSFDILIMITDGNPTAYTNASGGNSTGHTRLYEVERGIFSANAVKAEGTHIAITAVGDGVSQAATAHNLRAISDSGSFTRSNDYAAAASLLRAQVLRTCTPSVTVTKEIQPWGGGARVPGAGWDFTATVPEDGGLTLVGNDPTRSTGTHGGVQWMFSASGTEVVESVTVTELLKGGYTLVKQDNANATCTLRNGDTPVTGITIDVENIEDDADPGFIIDKLGAGDMVTCLVINKQPEPLRAALTWDGRWTGTWNWQLTKQVVPAETWAVPGADVKLDYTITVTPTLEPTGYTASGTVTVTNPNATGAIPLSDVVITVDGEKFDFSDQIAAQLDAGVLNEHGWLKAGQKIVILVTWENETDAEGGVVAPTAPIELLVTIEGRDGPMGAEVDFSSLGPVTTNAEAVLTDTFPQFAAKYGAVVTLDADNPTNSPDTPAWAGVWNAATRAWIFTYATTVSAPEAEGDEDTVWNDALLTIPESGEEIPAKVPSDIFTGKSLELTESALLSVEKAVSWDITKAVVDGPLIRPAGPEGWVDFTYLVTAQPLAAQYANWVSTTEVTISNPNSADNPNEGYVAASLTHTFDVAGQGNPALVTCTPVVEEGAPAIDLDDLSLPPGETTLKIRCELGTADDGGPLTGTLLALLEWDETMAFSATSEDEFPLILEELDFGPGQPVIRGDLEVTIWDDMYSTTEALGTAVWNDELEPETFQYVLRHDADETGTATWVNEACIVEMGLCDDVTVTVLSYDLALRTWVNEIWRDGVRTYQRYDDVIPGPDDVIPYAAFDDAAEIRIGDTIVKPIVIVNQGARTARVTELTHYLSPGLEVDDPHWTVSTSPTGLTVATRDLRETPLVLTPGEWTAVSITLRVTEDVMDNRVHADGDDATFPPGFPGDLDGAGLQVHANAMGFAEIGVFEGWVPDGDTAEDEVEEGVLARAWNALLSLFRSGEEEYDGFAGTWSGVVFDVDSTPGDSAHVARALVSDDAWIELEYLEHRVWDNALGTPQIAAHGANGTDPWATFSDDTDGEILLVPAPLPLTVDLMVDATQNLDFDWRITKDVTSPAEVETTVAGEDVEFGYLLTVTASADWERIFVTGTAKVTNPSSVPVDLASLAITVGDVDATFAVQPGAIAGGGSAEIDFTAVLQPEQLQLLDDGGIPVVATVVSSAVGLVGPATVTHTDTIEYIQHSVSDHLAFVEDEFDEFAQAYPDEYERWLDALERIEWPFGYVIDDILWTFEYTAARGADVSSGEIGEFPNIARVIPETPEDPEVPPPGDRVDDQPEGDLEDDAIVIVHAPVYDLALRQWTAAVIRPGEGLVSERDFDLDSDGPDYVVDYVAFDNDDVDVTIGDLLVTFVRVFNQGDRPVQVDELKTQKGPGLALVPPAMLAELAEFEGLSEAENDGWVVEGDVSVYRFAEGEGILRPGEAMTISKALYITPEVLADTCQFSAAAIALNPDVDDHDMWIAKSTEITGFRGWVPDEPVNLSEVENGEEEPEPIVPMALASFAVTGLAEILPAAEAVTAPGAWKGSTAGVLDIDSYPGTAFVRPMGELVTLWEDNLITATGDPFDFDRDHDDHDASMVQVFLPDAPPPPPEPTPTPTPTQTTPTPDTRPTPPPSRDTERAPLRTETGGYVVDDNPNLWFAFSALVLAGLVLAIGFRRTRPTVRHDRR